MSRASEHVKWCINKANKEIAECRKLGKREKHRGLLKINSNLDIIKSHLEKAEHDFKAINKFSEIGFSDWSVNASFYTIYQCFLAIGLKFGYESGNQECTISLIEWLNKEGKINIDKKFIEILKHEESKEIDSARIIDMREDYTYGIEVSFNDKNKLNELIKTCKEMIDITKEIVLK